MSFDGTYFSFTETCSISRATFTTTELNQKKKNLDTSVATGVRCRHTTKQLTQIVDEKLVVVEVDELLLPCGVDIRSQDVVLLQGQAFRVLTVDPNVSASQHHQAAVIEKVFY